MPTKQRSILSPKTWSGHNSFASLVLNDILAELFFFTGWAAAITAIHKYSHKIGISSQMLTVLGTVLGLVISFRTTSAYDRYWEGRKLWSSLTLASRNLSQLIWIHIPNKRKTAPAGSNEKDAELRAILEKKTMVNLVQSFSVAVKHYLRGEEGIFYEDLYSLVSFLPQHTGENSAFTSADDALPLWHQDTNLLDRIQTLRRTRAGSAADTSASANADDVEKADDYSEDSHHGRKLPPNIKLMPARNPPKLSLYDYFPVFLPLKPIISLLLNFFRPDREKSGRDWLGRKIKPQLSVESNVPLEISLFLSSYMSYCLNNDLLKPAIAVQFVNNMHTFQDVMTNLERIRSTPIPFAYQMHLRMTIWLYLLFLPFQIILVLDWITVPATAFAAFLFLGFLEIGAEIEDPFDYDENDLDLDEFCERIRKETSQVTAHPAPIDPATYIFSSHNAPLAPGDIRSAEVILRDVSHDYHHADAAVAVASVRRTMLRGWREINTKRKHRLHQTHAKKSASGSRSAPMSTTTTVTSHADVLQLGGGRPNAGDRTFTA